MIRRFTIEIAIDRIEINNYTANKSQHDLHGITYDAKSKGSKRRAPAASYSDRLGALRND